MCYKDTCKLAGLSPEEGRWRLLPGQGTQCRSWACCVCFIFSQAEIGVFLCPATCPLPSPEVFEWLSTRRADPRLRMKFRRKEKQLIAGWFALPQAAVPVNSPPPGYLYLQLFLWAEEWRRAPCDGCPSCDLIQKALPPYNFYLFLIDFF